MNPGDDSLLLEVERMAIGEVCEMVAYYYFRLKDLDVPDHVISRLISDYAFQRLLSL